MQREASLDQLADRAGRLLSRSHAGCRHRIARHGRPDCRLVGFFRSALMRIVLAKSRCCQTTFYTDGPKSWTRGPNPSNFNRTMASFVFARCWMCRPTRRIQRPSHDPERSTGKYCQTLGTLVARCLTRAAADVPVSGQLIRIRVRVKSMITIKTQPFTGLDALLSKLDENGRWFLNRLSGHGPFWLSCAPTSLPLSQSSLIMIWSSMEELPRVRLLPFNIDSLFVSLGEYNFSDTKPAAVIVSNAGANGYVVIDAVQWLPK